MLVIYIQHSSNPLVTNLSSQGSTERINCAHLKAWRVTATYQNHGLRVALSWASMTKAVWAESLCVPDFGAAKYIETHAS